MGNHFPPREVVEHLRREYPNGTRVELVSMDDPYNRRLIPGDKGTVRAVDDIGTVFVDWDCGSALGVVYRVDRIKKLGRRKNRRPDEMTGALPDRVWIE